MANAVLSESCTNCRHASFDTPCDLAPDLAYFQRWFLHEENLNLSIPPTVIDWHKVGDGLIVVQTPDSTQIGNVTALTYFSEDEISRWEFTPEYKSRQMSFLRSDDDIDVSYAMDTVYWRYVTRPRLQRHGPFVTLEEAIAASDID